MQPEQTIRPNEISRRDELVSEIPVVWFIEEFNVTHPAVIEALHEFPTLCYMLGNVTATPQTEDSRPDGVERPVYFLTEGSGMFGLEHPEDAMRWRGIFNHIVGSARHVYWLNGILASLQPNQKEQFAVLGYDRASFAEIDSELLRDFMLLSHAGRRQMDEHNWHNLRDPAHPSGNSAENTTALLKNYNVPPIFLNLMRIENHGKYLMTVAEQTIFSNIVDNVLTYSDWTFGQQPNTLKDRFAGLRARRRESDEVLAILESCSSSFEAVLQQIVDRNIFEQMTHAGPYEWEERIRRAYCAPSGINLEEAFPTYIQYLQDLG